MAVSRGPSRNPVVRPGIRLVAFAAAFLLTYAVLILLPAGQRFDSGSYGAISVPAWLFTFADLYRLSVPVVLVAACAVSAVGALWQRRIAPVVISSIIVVVPALLSEVLKLVLPRPNFGAYGYSRNTFPSGHVALALSAAIGLATLTPPSRRRGPLIAVAGLLAIGVSWTSVVSFAHRPSDVIGSSLVVGFVATAVLWGRPTMVEWRTRQLIMPACAAGAGLVLAVAGALLNDVGSANVLLGGPGWFLLCAIPGALVIGASPQAVPAVLERRD